MSPEKFYDWLEERGALHPFLRNCHTEVWDIEESIKEGINGDHPENMILMCFEWAETPQKSAYWCKIHDEFESFILSKDKKDGE